MSCQNDSKTQERGLKEVKTILWKSMPPGPLEACTFGPHLGNRSVFILDPCLKIELFFLIENIIALKDKKLWDKITDSNSTTALDDLLPPERTMVMLRKKRHNYIFLPVRTEHFKRTLICKDVFL